MVQVLSQLLVHLHDEHESVLNPAPLTSLKAQTSFFLRTLALFRVCALLRDGKARYEDRADSRASMIASLSSCI